VTGGNNVRFADLGCSLLQQCYDPATPSFGPALQNAYFRRADVINRGFGGYNTDWLLPVLEKQILPSVFNVVLWIILIGSNDAMLPEGPNHVTDPPHPKSAR
jgi:isoamyl acetate esterase